MNIVLLGKPGVGKGTIAKLIQKDLGFVQLSAGDLIRSEIKSKSAIGKKIEPIVASGKLIADEITILLIKRALKKIKNNNIIFDGYPREILQAKLLEKVAKVDLVIYLEASDKIIINRLSGRRICSKCGAIYHIRNQPPKKAGVCDKDKTKLIIREDDKPSVIKERLKVHKTQTKPLINYYTKKRILKKVDASDNPKNIIKVIKKILFKVIICEALIFRQRFCL